MMEFVNEKMRPGGAGSDFKNLLQDHFYIVVIVVAIESYHEQNVFWQVGWHNDEDPLHRKLLALQINWK